MLDFVFEKVDLVFCPCSYLLPAINFIKPFVLLVPDIVAFLDNTRQGHKKSVIFKEKMTLKFAIRNSKKIIAISNSTKNDLLKYFRIKPGKIEVVYLAVRDDFRVIKDKSCINSVISKYGISITDKYYLFVSTIEPRKNIEKLIDAYYHLKNNYNFQNQKIVIAGKKGWYYENVFKKVDSLGLSKDIVFIGYVSDSDLPYLYNGAGSFIYPSLYEGFGILVLEAMNCACPVITSNNSSIPEVAGDAALYIDPQNEKDIAEAMKTISSNNKLREKLVLKGIE